MNEQIPDGSIVLLWERLKSPPIKFEHSLLDFNRVFAEMLTAACAIPNWVWRGYGSRRAMIEDALGYHLPDWVWTVEETQRKTLGSGNGREIRP